MCSLAGGGASPMIAYGGVIKDSLSQVETGRLDRDKRLFLYVRWRRHVAGIEIWWKIDVIMMEQSAKVPYSGAIPHPFNAEAKGMIGS